MKNFMVGILASFLVLCPVQPVTGMAVPDVLGMNVDNTTHAFESRQAPVPPAPLSPSPSTVRHYPITKVQCGEPSLGTADRRGVSHLVDPLSGRRQPAELRQSANSCVRHACRDNSAIYVCNYNNHEIRLSWRGVAQVARDINPVGCCHGGRSTLSGEAWVDGNTAGQNNGNWSVVIGYGNCRHSPYQAPFTYGRSSANPPDAGCNGPSVAQSQPLPSNGTTTVPMASQSRPPPLNGTGAAPAVAQSRPPPLNSTIAAPAISQSRPPPSNRPSAAPAVAQSRPQSSKGTGQTGHGRQRKVMVRKLKVCWW